MSVDYKAIGKKIRLIRTQHELTIEQMAEILNLSASYMGLIERGQRGISIETLYKFSTIFNVSTDYLLFAEDEGKGQLLESVTNSHQKHILSLTQQYSEKEFIFLIEFIKLKNKYDR